MLCLLVCVAEEWTSLCAPSFLCASAVKVQCPPFSRSADPIAQLSRSYDNGRTHYDNACK